MCTDVNGNSRELILLMIAVSNTGSDAEAIIDELLVQVVCSDTPVAIFAYALRIGNINDIQATFFWVKRSLSLSSYCDECEQCGDDGLFHNERLICSFQSNDLFQTVHSK